MLLDSYVLQEQRISELIKIKVEHVKLGYIDLYTKGGKIRIYIPISLKKETLKWLEEIKIESGYIFKNEVIALQEDI